MKGFNDLCPIVVPNGAGRIWRNGVLKRIIGNGREYR